MAKVLLTGSAGSIGTVLTTGLAATGHDVIGLDLPGRGANLSVDCTDPVAVDEAMAEVGPDAVIHLAGIPTESSLPDALASHVVSTGAIVEAMLRHDVPRIVYASSNHAVGRTPRADVGAEGLGADVSARPDTYYGVAKVAAEALLHLYVDRHGIDAISTRIGSFLERPTTRRHLSTWLSHDDAVRMFGAALTAPSPGFAIVYGISANTRGWWDLAPGRALGYDPQDDAEVFAAEVEAEPETDTDLAQGAHVGGPFASGEFDRPAFD